MQTQIGCCKIQSLMRAYPFSLGANGYVVLKNYNDTNKLNQIPLIDKQTHLFDRDRTVHLA